MDVWLRFGRYAVEIKIPQSSGAVVLNCQCYTGKVKREKRRVAAAPVGKIKAKERAPRPSPQHALIFGVIALALLAYSNSFHAPFLLDNAEAILKDTRVHAATGANVARILGKPYAEAALTGLYRPLSSLSYLYNYAVLGDGANPAGYHWFNFLLHALNIGLVYALGLVLFDDIPAALMLSALWGLHPVLTESVTNIVGRADLLAAFGVLASLLCYHRSLRSPGTGRVSWLAAAALAATIGMFAKESGVVALAAIAAYDWIYARAAPWRARLAGYAAVAVPAIVFFAVRAHVMGRSPIAPFPFIDNPLTGAGFWTARVAAFRVIGRYFGLLIWPGRLAPDYSYNEIPVRADAASFLVLALCIAAAAVAIRSWNRARVLSFAIAFFFVTLAPVSNVFVLIGSIMAERFLYLPSVGAAAAAVFGVRAVWRRGPAYRIGSYAVAAILLTVFGARTYARNRDWLDDQRFWSRAADATPGNAKAHMNAAVTTPLDKRQDRDRAAAHADLALSILSGLPDQWNAGIIYRQAGGLFREIGDRYTAGQSAPDGTDPMSWYMRSAEALARSERIEKALDETCRALNARRGTPQATFLPGDVYLEIGRTQLRMLHHEEAIAAFETARNLGSDPVVLEELGRTYAAVEQPRKAAQAFVEALLVDSSRTHLSQQIMDLYGKVDPQGCAVAREGGSPSLNLACPMVHGDICAASGNVARNYDHRNQTAEAASIRRVAVEDLGCAVPLVK
jgi:tetratricopeptide (TPR) repeat protein